MAVPLKTIRENSREDWLDDEVHRHYNVPMVAVRAEPRVLVHCNVCRDTASVLEKWVQIQSEFESVADLPERFLYKVPIPPFQVAEVRIKTNKFPCYWRLRANTGRHMIDTSFWHLWKSILQQDSFIVGPFDVILKVPSHTPAWEDPVDPWNMFPSNDRSGATGDGFSYLRWDRSCNDSVPLDFTCLADGTRRNSSPLASRGRPGSTSAIRELPQRVRDFLFL